MVMTVSAHLGASSPFTVNKFVVYPVVGSTRLALPTWCLAGLIGKSDQVQRKAGFGSFGTVVQAQDVLTGTLVAVKMLHNIIGLHQDIHREERVYESLAGGCNPRISLFAQVLHSGTHQGFHCTVFEYCDATLFDLIEAGGELMPLPVYHVREMALQIIRGVQYLHSLGIIHTDIKPDNIAIRRADTAVVQRLDETGAFRSKKVLVCTALCIIDLGGAITFSEALVAKGLVCARMYRAPEVILGMRWSHGVDTYAIGCVIAELCLACNLFDPAIESDSEHLAMVERVVGRFPEEFARAVEITRPGTFSQDARTLIYDAALVDLLKKMMMPDPARRCALGSAERHVYFDKVPRHQWLRCPR
ncbi:kinase-like protein [Trametes sanguinea]|nr:kinase-like protein [Trametes sanguinea]